MKILALIFALTSSGAFAATVHSAKLDKNKKNILVEVSYSGGCKTHKFALKVGSCLETYPVRCSAELKETTVGGPDLCEALVGETVTLNLSQYRLDEAYYAGGSLTITGDRDMNGNPSTATVVLP